MLTVTLVIWSFLGAPFSSESAFVCETLPQNCPTELRFECFMFAGHEAVSCVGVATCAKRAVNLRLLSPEEGGGMGPPC